MRFASHGFTLVKITIPLLVAVGLFIALVPAYGNQLLERSLSVSNGAAGATADYKLAFTVGTASLLGSIRLQICANDPLIGTPCTAPAGFDAQTAVLSAQSGETGFTLSPLSTSNVIILSRVPSASQALPSEYEFSDIINPTSTGSYYGRLETFATNDASGPNIDYGGLALSVNNSLTISAEVPPYLTFCTGITIAGLDCNAVNGSYANFGTLLPTRTAAVTSQFLVATNAVDGYSVGVAGNTLTSGNNVIGALASTDVSRPGTAQFGLNLRANTTPTVGTDAAGPGNGAPLPPYNQADHYVFNSANNIAGATAPDDFRKYTVSYLVNVPKSQAPGVYVSTITYTAIGNF